MKSGFNLQKRIRIIAAGTLMLAAVAFLSCSVFAIAAERYELLSPSEVMGEQYASESTYSVVLVNLTDGETVYSDNALAPRSTSGVGDLMFIYTALSNTDGSETVTVLNDGLFEHGSAVNVDTLLNTWYYSRDAVIRDELASYIAGSPADYVELMNRSARSLMMVNTHFLNLDSTYDRMQYSTAFDAYKVTSELLGNDRFLSLLEGPVSEISYLLNGCDSKLSFIADSSLIESPALSSTDYEVVFSMTSWNPEMGDNGFYAYRDSLGKVFLSVVMAAPAGFSPDRISAVVLDGIRTSDVILATAADSSTYFDPETSVYIPTGSNDERYRYILGTDYYPYSTLNPAPGYATEAEAARNMRTVTLPVWVIGPDDTRVSSTYTIRIHKNLVQNVRAIFNEIYALDYKFPINYMVGYRYRPVGGSGLVMLNYQSIHSFGAAIDINPGDYDNDLYLGYHQDLRDKSNPYCITDEVIAIFAKYGWFWGGDFAICSDTMHFQYLGLDFMKYDSAEPFPILRADAANMSGAVITNLQQRLSKLGFLPSEGITGVYDDDTQAAVMAFQKENNFEQNGVVAYEVWVRLINLTHDMSYVF